MTSIPKFTGKRIQVSRSKGEIVVTISQQIERWQEAILLAWLAAWTFCGIFFIYYTFTSTDLLQRVFFACFSAGWFYFFIRIIKVFFWRRKGKEILTFKGGKLYLKNAIGNSGRVEEFSFHNIFKLGLVNSDPTSFLAFLDDSFWIIGGERVGFNYSGSKIRLGKQLTRNEAELLVRTIESAMKECK